MRVRLLTEIATFSHPPWCPACSLHAQSVMLCPLYHPFPLPSHRIKVLPQHLQHPAVTAHALTTPPHCLPASPPLAASLPSSTSLFPIPPAPYNHYTPWNPPPAPCNHYTPWKPPSPCPNVPSVIKKAGASLFTNTTCPQSPLTTPASPPPRIPPPPLSPHTCLNISSTSFLPPCPSSRLPANDHA